MGVRPNLDPVTHLPPVAARLLLSGSRLLPLRENWLPLEAALLLWTLPDSPGSVGTGPGPGPGPGHCHSIMKNSLKVDVPQGSSLIHIVSRKRFVRASWVLHQRPLRTHCQLKSWRERLVSQRARELTCPHKDPLQ